MGKRFVLVALLVCFLSTSASAQWNRHRRRGTIIGGVAGAAIGAAIGDRRNNEAVGAVIGGVAGAVIGGNVGANKDHRIENSGRQYYSQPQYTQRQYSHRYPVYPQPAPVIVQAPVVVPAPVIVPAPVSPPPAHKTFPMVQEDVVNMLRSGLSETMVASQIQRRGMAHALSVNDIIGLHQQGVSEQLIDYMQASVVAGAPQIQSQSHTSYSMPAQQTTQQPVQYPAESSVILNNASGQSILTPAN